MKFPPFELQRIVNLKSLYYKTGDITWTIFTYCITIFTFEYFFEAGSDNSCHLKCLAFINKKIGKEKSLPILKIMLCRA